MENNEKDISQYLEDISTIKRRMDELEEKPYVENWAFFAWGSIILIATFANLWLWEPLKLTNDSSFFGIWIPAVVLLIITECISGFQVMNRYSVAVITRNFLKFLVAAGCIVTVGFVLLFYLLDTHAPLPGMILLVSSIFYFLFSLYSFSYTSIQGGLIFIIGLIFSLLNISGTPFLIFTGLINSAAFFSIGIIEIIRGKDRE